MPFENILQLETSALGGITQADGGRVGEHRVHSIRKFRLHLASCPQTLAALCRPWVDKLGWRWWLGRLFTEAFGVKSAASTLARIHICSVDFGSTSSYNQMSQYFKINLYPLSQYTSCWFCFSRKYCLIQVGWRGGYAYLMFMHLLDHQVGVRK